MFNFLLKILLHVAGSTAVKEAVKYGAKELVKRTDTGIDDALAENLLGNIQDSNRNSIKKIAIQEVSEYVEDKAEEAIYDLSAKASSWKENYLGRYQ